MIFDFCTRSTRLDERREVLHRDVGVDVVLEDARDLGVLRDHLGRVDLLDDCLDDAALAHLAEGVAVGGAGAGVPEGVVAVEVLAAGLEVALDAEDAAVSGVLAADRQAFVP